MTIKKSVIETTMFNPELGGSHAVTVIYTDELSGEEVFDLAYCSAIGNYLPYLFVGYFSDDEEGPGKWFFANARKHDEMRQAIEQDIGKKSQFCYGQIHVSKGRLSKGEFRFYQLLMHSLPPNAKQAEELFRRVVDPELLTEDFEIAKTHF